MDSITKEIYKVAEKGYADMGVSADYYAARGKVKNIYDFLGIVPEIDSQGKRIYTPYELLGVLPNIQNGEEKPIIFFVKNKIKNLKPVKTSNNLDFVYLKEKNEKNDDELIKFIIESYKTAVVQNNQAEADRFFAMLDDLTGGRAKHYISEGYDYTKFYRQMKKQLIIDLFSHFFMLYLMQQKSIIKAGLVIKNKKYKAFNLAQTNKSIEKDCPHIKSIRIDSVSMDSIETNEGNVKEIEKDLSAKTKILEREKVSPINNQPLPEKKDNQMPERKSFIKRVIRRFRRKDKKNKVVQTDFSNNEIAQAQDEKEVCYE